MNLLITGPTGFLGQILTSQFAKDHNLYLLVRNESVKKSQQLFESLDINRLVYCEGDLTNPEVFLDHKQREQVLSSIDGIIHLAALYDLKGSLEAHYLNNVIGTQNLLFIASQCKQLKFFAHVSSIAIAGNYEGPFPEDKLEFGQKFSNAYAESKYLSEKLIREWSPPEKVKKIIFRPGIIVGNSQSGAFLKVDGPYYFLKSLAKIYPHRFLINALKYLPLPYDKNAILPFIPVDQTVYLISKVIEKYKNLETTEQGSCFHLVGEDGPKVGTFIQDAFDAFGFKVTVVPLPKSVANDLLVEKIGLPKELASYVYSPALFPMEGLKVLCPEIQLPRYNSYKINFFNAAKSHFKLGKKS